MITVESLRDELPENVIEAIKSIFKRLHSEVKYEKLSKEEELIKKQLTSEKDEFILSIIQSIRHQDFSFYLTDNAAIETCRNEIDNRKVFSDPPMSGLKYDYQNNKERNEKITWALFLHFKNTDMRNYTQCNSYLNAVRQLIIDLHLIIIEKHPFGLSDDLKEDEKIKYGNKRVEELLKISSKIPENGMLATSLAWFHKYRLTFPSCEFAAFIDRCQEITLKATNTFKNQLKRKFLNFSLEIDANEEILKETYPKQIIQTAYKVLSYRFLARYYDQSERWKLIEFLNGELNSDQKINTISKASAPLSVFKWLFQHKKGNKLSVGVYELQERIMNHFTFKGDPVDSTTVARHTSNPKYSINKDIESELEDLEINLSIK